MKHSIRHIHFVGIGGSGMSGLARMFLARGIRVSGSDRADSPGLRELEALGATVVARIQRWIVMEAPTGHRFCVVNPQGPAFDANAKDFE